jgi:hypothetical protein
MIRLANLIWVPKSYFSQKVRNFLNSIFVSAAERASLTDLLNSDFLLSISQTSTDGLQAKEKMVVDE